VSAQVLDDPADILAQSVGLEILDARESRAFHELAVDVPLQVLEGLVLIRAAERPGQS